MKYLTAGFLFFLGVVIFPFDSRNILSPAALIFSAMSCLLVFFSYRVMVHGNEKFGKNKILPKSDLIGIEKFTTGLDKYFKVESFADFVEIDSNSLSIAIGVKKRGEKIIIGTISVYRETVGLNSCSMRAYNGNRLPGKEYYSTVQEALFENRHYFASMVGSLNKIASGSLGDEEDRHALN
jgi:hypothetical protein